MPALALCSFVVYEFAPRKVVCCWVVRFMSAREEKNYHAGKLRCHASKTKPPTLIIPSQLDTVI